MVSVCRQCYWALSFLSTSTPFSMARPTTIALLVTATTQYVSARPEYVEMLPNGANTGVEALGHTNTIGSGGLTAFGEDFAAAGNKWTKELCEKDSDGDGQSNGAELGDPCCEWARKTNQKVEWIDGVSSPADATKKSDPALWANINCTTITTITTSAPSAVPAPATSGAAASGVTLGGVTFLSVLVAAVAVLVA